MQWKNKSKTANLHRWDQRQPLRGSDIWTEQAGGTVVIQAKRKQHAKLGVKESRLSSGTETKA